MWSNSGISICSPAPATLSVSSLSALLGVGSPLGWLCTRMIFTALSFNASKNISLGEIRAMFTQPSDSFFSRINCPLASRQSRYTHSVSLCRSFSMKYSATISARVKQIPVLALARLIRLDNSAMHFNFTAFTMPIPRICVNSSTLTSCRPKSPSLGYFASARTFSASSTAEVSLVPVRRMTARSSASVRFSGPNCWNRS